MADLLIHGEIGQHAPVQPELLLFDGLHHSQQDGGAGLVVHKAGFEVAAGHGEAGFQGDHVAGFDP